MKNEKNTTNDNDIGQNVKKAIVKIADLNGDGKIDSADLGVGLNAISQKTAEFATARTKDVSNGVNKVVDGTKATVNSTKKIIVNTLDENDDGVVDIQDMIYKGLKYKNIRINRSDFLQKELQSKYPQSVIDDAIKYNPAHAGIKTSDIDAIAEQTIEFERRNVSAISLALGLPSGTAAFAAVPADVVQYYAFMLRTIQELLYLYGFPQIDTNEKSLNVNSETMNIFVICFGVMYAVKGANAVLISASKGIATQVGKTVMATALTRTTIYPVLKSILKFFSVRLTKTTLANFFEKSIPVAGAVASGGITYLSFKPCCENLKNTLQNTELSNPSKNTLKDAINE
jgi:hypothetical protein